MSLLRKFLSKISPFTYFRKLRKWYGLQIDLYKEVKLLKMEQLKIKEQLKNSMLSGNSNPQKKKIDENTITQSDLKLVNDSIVSYIKNLAQSELEARINEVAVDWQSGALDLKLAKETLAREGILILKNFLNDDLILEAEKSVASMKKILVQTNGDKNYDFDNLFVQSSTAPELVGYRKLSTHPKAVANIRTGADEGMIDVFNFDKFFSGDKEQLRKPFSDPALMELFQSDSSQSEATTLNLYLNSNITKTRGFHVDSYDTSYKGLCYLTDVPSLDFGPYCYIRKSHVDGPWRRINQQFSSLLPFKTEAPIFDPLDIIPCVAPKGSLILSDQSGIHRGFPQSPGHERQVLVMRYR